MVSVLDILSAASSAATAIGILLAVWQIHLAKSQATTEFEDNFTKEYRDLTSKLPVKAFFGDSLTDQEFDAALQWFYHYFDLCNEQIFLRQAGRITRRTWLNWSTGMKGNLARSAFKKAWEQIKEKSNEDFQEMRRLEIEAFNSDPKSWRRRG